MSRMPTRGLSSFKKWGDEGLLVFNARIQMELAAMTHYFSFSPHLTSPHLISPLLFPSLNLSPLFFSCLCPSLSPSP
jgi:hypothetical protein